LKTMSAPSGRTASTFASEPADAITRAPAITAACTAAPATPPEAEGTSTVSPGRTRATLTTIDQAARQAGEQARAAAASWTLDEDAYLASGRFTEELLAAAQETGLQLFERDDRLYCYPVLVRVAPAERSVFVDRARERRLRPSVLVAHLREVQRKPPRFRPETFLESLFTAYSYLVKQYGPSALDGSHTEPLVHVYELLTLQPGAARDYSRQEFARDIYLLDRGGVTTTRRGFTVSFPASTGARSASASVRVVTESGQEKVYYGIAFSPGG